MFASFLANANWKDVTIGQHTINGQRVQWNLFYFCLANFLHLAIKQQKHPIASGKAHSWGLQWNRCLAHFWHLRSRCLRSWCWLSLWARSYQLRPLPTYPGVWTIEEAAWLLFSMNWQLLPKKLVNCKRGHLINSNWSPFYATNKMGCNKALPLSRYFVSWQNLNMAIIQGVFLTGTPPKKLKYVKPRLGESTLA